METVTTETVLGMAQGDGSFSSSAEQDLRKMVCVSGVQPGALAFVWKHVLGYLKFSMTKTERDELDARHHQEYFVYRQQCQLITNEQLENWDEMHLTFEQIGKDVKRTDVDDDKFPYEANIELLRAVLQTRAVYINIGYGQGMNDLCSLLMNTTLDNCELFWLFSCPMSLVRPFYQRSKSVKDLFAKIGDTIPFVNPQMIEHFYTHEVDYLFCFKWVVLLFKPDFSIDFCLRLLDSTFASPERRLFLFICNAIIMDHAEIIDQEMKFDGMVAFLQKLHNKIPADITFSTDIINQ